MGISLDVHFLHAAAVNKVIDVVPPSAADIVSLISESDTPSACAFS
jgi:hypothetical protein